MKLKQIILFLIYQESQTDENCGCKLLNLTSGNNLRYIEV